MPTQPRYDDEVPTRDYHRLANAVGCEGPAAFDCLVEADSLELQRAANSLSSSEPTFYGSWQDIFPFSRYPEELTVPRAFIPVTDDTYITGPPSVLLSKLKGRVNGERILVGVRTTSR